MFVTSQAGGLALPLYMLMYQRDLGVQAQCAFTLAQYSFAIDSSNQVRIWGLLRDLAATGRKRPTWLGVELANKAISGNLVGTFQSGVNPTYTQTAINGLSGSVTFPLINSFAYTNGKERSLILFNLSLTDTQPVTIDLAETPLATATKYELYAADPHATNEDANNVQTTSSTISDFRDLYPMTLPAHSMSVLTWSAQ
jgi:hypothetical protein